MNKVLFTTLLCATALAQVACSKDEKEAALKYCEENNEDCVRRYYQAAGAAAAESKPQVADKDATVIEEGQVPSTEILPASITDAQIKAKAEEVSTALNSIGGSVTTTSTSAAPASVSAPALRTTASSAAAPLEVGVVRLFDDEEDSPTTSSSMTPASAVAAPLFSSPAPTPVAEPAAGSNLNSGSIR